MLMTQPGNHVCRALAIAITLGGLPPRPPVRGCDHALLEMRARGGISAFRVSPAELEVEIATLSDFGER
jgi:hypothetical protein